MKYGPNAPTVLRLPEAVYALDGDDYHAGQDYIVSDVEAAFYHPQGDFYDVLPGADLGIRNGKLVETLGESDSPVGNQLVILAILAGVGFWIYTKTK